MQSERLRLPLAGRLMLPVLAAVAAVAVNLGPPLAELGLERALAPPPLADREAVLMFYSRLPRLAMSLIAGAALALSGTLLQQILRNPLASPSTVGIEAGAQLALAVALLFAPVLLGISRDLTTLAGGLAAMLAVFAAAWRFGFSPLVVMLAGLMVGLYANAVVTILALMKDRYLDGLFIWGGGSLVQQDWRPVLSLLPRVAAGLAVALLLVRPIDLLQLDEGARALGLRVAGIRAAGLVLAVALTAVTVSAVGVIGFLGLAAPALARRIGARRFRDRLLAAPVVGAALLVLTDQLLQILEGRTGIVLPPGAVTAVLGAPVLLVLVRQMSTASMPPAAHAPPRRRPAAPLLAVLAVLTPAFALAAIVYGPNVEGALTIASATDLEALLPWRLPRTLAALSGGIMLAMAGVLVQRFTLNPIASPEVLGISSGAAFGLMAALFLADAPGYSVQTGAAAAGAMAVFLVLLWLERRRENNGERLLYSGVALGALLTAVIAVVIATGDPRAMLLLRWMTGATYQIDATTAAAAAGLAAGGLAAVPLLARPLELLGLGNVAARAAGLDVRAARLLILSLVSVMTAAATLIVGPLGFIGLMAPHLARRAGLVRVLPQTLGAALIGGLLMTLADYLGRAAYFPWQLPSGIVATLLGGPVLFLLLADRNRQGGSG